MAPILTLLAVVSLLPASASPRLDAAKGDAEKLEILNDKQSKEVLETENALQALHERYRDERDELDAIRKERSRVLMTSALAAWRSAGEVEVLEELSPERLNAPFVASGGEAPFAADMPAEKIRVLKPLELCQGQSREALEKGWYGSWFMPCASDHYENQRLLRDLAALPDSNNLEYIARLRVPAGVELILGTAGPIRSAYAARVDRFYVDSEGRPIGGGGHGGAVQLWLDAKSQGKSRASDFGIEFVGMAPIPKSDDSTLLKFSIKWHRSKGHPDQSRRVYASYLAYKKKHYAGASAALKSDFELFDGFFPRSFARRYPNEPPLAP